MGSVGRSPGAATQPGQRIGSFIGGVFGLIYVEVNAGVLAAPAAAAMRLAGAVAFAGLLALLAVTRGSGATAAEAARSRFGARYWLVVAAEVVAIAAGSALLNGPLDQPRAVVAWVSVVVGTHFFALAAVWRVSMFRWLGAAIVLCGLAGLAAASVGRVQRRDRHRRGCSARWAAPRGRLPRRQRHHLAPQPASPHARRPVRYPPCNPTAAASLADR